MSENVEIEKKEETKEEKLEGDKSEEKKEEKKVEKKEIILTEEQQQKFDLIRSVGEECNNFFYNSRYFRGRVKESYKVRKTTYLL
jgi:hypothetical protein